MDQYMTTAEVADLLRASTETVRYWRHIGKGPASFKIGRRVLYARADVETFIAEARRPKHDYNEFRREFEADRQRLADRGGKTYSVGEAGPELFIPPDERTEL